MTTLLRAKVDNVIILRHRQQAELRGRAIMHPKNWNVRNQSTFFRREVGQKCELGLLESRNSWTEILITDGAFPIYVNNKSIAHYYITALTYCFTYLIKVQM